VNSIIPELQREVVSAAAPVAQVPSASAREVALDELSAAGRAASAAAATPSAEAHHTLEAIRLG
jgi:hypothetical protein